MLRDVFSETVLACPPNLFVPVPCFIVNGNKKHIKFSTLINLTLLYSS